MAKVELENIRLAVTAIGKQIVATIPNKDGLTMKHKHDVSSDFFKCIVDYGKNSRFNIAGEEGKAEEFQVGVVPRNGWKQAIYTRKEVRKLLEKMIVDEVGEKINLEQWVEKNLI